MATNSSPKVDPSTGTPANSDRESRENGTPAKGPELTKPSDGLVEDEDGDPVGTPADKTGETPAAFDDA